VSPSAYEVTAAAANTTSGRRNPTRETATQHTIAGNQSVASPTQLLTTVLYEPVQSGPHPTLCRARAAT